jgi:hypothetical protein
LTQYKCLIAVYSPKPDPLLKSFLKFFGSLRSTI